MLSNEAPGAAGPRAGSGFVGFGGTTIPTIAQAPADGKPDHSAEVIHKAAHGKVCGKLEVGA